MYIQHTCSISLNQAAKRIWRERWQFNKDGKRSLNTFKLCFKYLGGSQKKLHTITAEDLMELRLVLKEKRAAATVNRYLASVKTVLNQAFRIWRAVPYVPYIQMEKESGCRERILTYEEENLILGWLKKNQNKFSYTRRSYYNFYTLLMDTGTRPSELLRISPMDYNRAERSLYIKHGKIDDDRYVWLQGRAVDAIEDQIIIRRGSTMFPFKVDSMGRYFNSIKRHLFIDDLSLTSYCYRHTCATRMVQAGVSSRVIQRQLGHKTLMTTQRYMKVNLCTLKKAMLKVEKRRIKVIK